MPTTAALFPSIALPRAPRRVMMHVTDAGIREDGADIACFRCGKCGHEEQWIEYRSVSAAKRGVPCPKCNKSET